MKSTMMSQKKGVAEGIIQFAIGLLLFVIVVVNVILPTVATGSLNASGYNSTWGTLVTLVGTVTIFGLVIYAAKAA